jgi:hypothetical protein
MAIRGPSTPLRASFAALAVALAACGGDASDGSRERDLGSASSPVVDYTKFTLPSLSLAERAQIVGKYAQLDPKALVPRGLLEDAIVYFDVNKAQIPKQAYFVVVDLSRYSGKDRFWMVDLKTGAVETHKVAHGDGSDPDNDGYATLFGNMDGSHMSSLGFYLTGEIYDGTHVHSMRLDGLSPDGSANGMANTNVRARLIVVHEADYVDDANTSQQGRSNGCLALDPSIEVSVVDRIHDGTLIYAAKAPLNPPVGAGTGGAGGSGAGGTGTSGAAGAGTGGKGVSGSAGAGAGTGGTGAGGAGASGQAGTSSTGGADPGAGGSTVGASGSGTAGAGSTPGSGGSAAKGVGGASVGGAGAGGVTKGSPTVQSATADNEGSAGGCSTSPRGAVAPRWLSALGLGLAAIALRRRNGRRRAE